ncbi:MAG: poly-gamma-glutamate synthase PgsB [Ignavibacteria bacterium RIFOXYB2_FULL_35_12]|nr:MAG: poly-gamma-glutamate synthase PgsB [Ignavibacteria bacterium GWA2_36_19]OGU55324.1 MAG: poly-gamma-glutamate synthase PgsB [Ignavibacteria bacterium GWC2_35_8]OGU59312.1 MAG: poly-gamma-glutamate synthase PgsB [Ignavibacteria bacterium GWF2_35_20]OGU80471.1 MAG: poly-gamma-glutamate synthase PgsB [Ignavibacteria bacterium RIFOXYA2_FULL_35_9]OGU86495.1 MAG: poly-gamma-glutamate synthase PgsB [Ignavibacteria bacterium RIFOXYA12_FULL_35_25]OGU86855.1 MAG: poly-gamma-glutamate synthase Pgs
MTLFFVLVIFSFILLIAEYWNIRRCVNKIPLRILVNGTRGKSSVTKYIAAGLRIADKRTIGKITGIIPTIIYPDGSEKIIKRIAPARIQEQFKVIRLASKLSADCLVLECMSITPALQKLETTIFRPNIFVITNIRDDHREQIGNEQEQVISLCEAIPSNSIVVTDEKKYLSEIEASAKSKNSSLIYVEDSINFKNIDIPTNVLESNIKIALAVCKLAKIEKEKSGKPVLEMIKNFEELLFEFPFVDKKIRFINGFAVNDVPSSQEFIDYWEKKLGGFRHLNIIFNSRSDRPLRSLVFAKWIGTIKNLNGVILIGSHIPRFRLELIRNGIKSQKITVWGKSKIKSVQENLGKIAGTDLVFIGLGNIAGDGLLLINSLKENALVRIDNAN